MAPKKDIDKLAWSWINDVQNDSDINQLHLESAYKIRIRICGHCRKNCSSNPRCLRGLGEHKFFNNKNFESAINVPSEDTVLQEIREDNSCIGLRNLGATCYLNSLLQVWFHNKSFRTALYKWDPCFDEDEKENFLKSASSEFRNYEPKSTIGHVQLIFALLEYSKRNYVDTSNFVNSLNLNPDMQQDLQEFSKLFMSLLEYKFDKQEDPLVRNIFEQFKGQYFYVTRCKTCYTESQCPSDFYELELNLQGGTLESCLDSYLDEEQLNEVDQYACTVCQKKQDATRQIRLVHLPRTLNLQLLRFVYDIKANMKRKIASYVTFPEILDMSKYIKKDEKDSDEENNHKYRLVAYLIHSGPSAYRGHYIAHVREESTGQWLRINDALVEICRNFNDSSEICDIVKPGKSAKRPKTPKDHIVSNNAYMLVYRLMSREELLMLESSSKKVKSSDNSDINECDISKNNLNVVNKQENPVPCNIDNIENNSASTEIVESTSSTKCRSKKGNNNVASEKIKKTENKVIKKNPQTSELISDDRLQKSDLPHYLKTLILHENSKFTERLDNYRDLQDVSQATLMAKQAEIKCFYEDAGLVEDQYEFISKEWLQKWFLLDSTTPSPIINTHLVCVHGNMDPTKVNYSKIVSKKAADYLYKNFDGGPRLDENNLCLKCVQKICELNQIKSKISKDQKLISQLLKKSDSSEECFWIGKYSFRSWRRFVLQRYKGVEPISFDEDDDKNSKSDETENTNSQLQNEDEKTNEATTEETENKDNHKDLDRQLSENEFNSEIICEHGNLCSDESSRRYIPRAVLDILLKYFPNIKTYALDSKVCEMCVKSEQCNRIQSDYYMSIALEQKEILQELFSNQSRPEIEHVSLNLYRRINLTDTGSDLLSSVKQTSESDSSNGNDNKLISDYTTDSDVKNEDNVLSESSTNENIANASESRVSCYFICADYIRSWRKFIRSGGKIEPLDIINNSSLICRHGKLAYSLTSDRMVPVNEKEWTTLLNYFTFDFEIKLTESSGRFFVTPELCRECFEDNAVFRIIVRKVISQDDSNETNKSVTTSKKSKKNTATVNTNTQPSVPQPPPPPSVAPARISRRTRGIRAVGDHERLLRVRSAGTLRDLQISIMDTFQVATFDQHLSIDGVDLILKNEEIIAMQKKLNKDAQEQSDTENSKVSEVSNAPTLSELGLYEYCTILLKADEPMSLDILDDFRSNEPEEGFKGTGLFI